MKKILSLIAYIILNHTTILAQELNFIVNVDASRLQTAQISEKTIFANLEKAIRLFLNDREWTNDQFKKNEQINCKLSITVTEAPSQNSFKATAQVFSSRTIYGTNYESSLLNFNDRNFEFDYFIDQPLIFNDNNFTSNLTSMLAFYAYTILALDYDSFSKLGGNPYIEKLFNVVNVAQSASGDAGWSRTQNQVNRYWLAENLQSQQMLPFREAIYEYHRKGMDLLLTKPDEARNTIYKTFQTMQEVNKLKPSSALFNVYFDAKNSEIVNVFKDATPELRQKVRLIVVQLDPANARKYDTLAY
jgi:hypothetical protein